MDLSWECAGVDPYRDAQDPFGDDDGADDRASEGGYFDAMCDMAADGQAMIDGDRREALAGLVWDLTASHLDCPGASRHEHRFCLLIEWLRTMVSQCRPATDYDPWGSHDMVRAAESCREVVADAYNALRHCESYAWRWADLVHEYGRDWRDGTDALRAIEHHWSDAETQHWAERMVRSATDAFTHRFRSSPRLGVTSTTRVVPGSVEELLPPRATLAHAFGDSRWDEWVQGLARQELDRALTRLATAHDALAEHLESLADEDERAAADHEAAAAEHNRSADEAASSQEATQHRASACLRRAMVAVLRSRAHAYRALAEHHRHRAAGLRRCTGPPKVAPRPHVRAHCRLPAATGRRRVRRADDPPATGMAAPSSAAVLALAA